MRSGRVPGRLGCAFGHTRSARRCCAGHHTTAVRARSGSRCQRMHLLLTRHGECAYTAQRSACACILTAPGVEPGLSRPQRDVLTTRRCGLLAAEVLLSFMVSKGKEWAPWEIGRVRKEIRGKSHLKVSATVQRRGEWEKRMLHLSFLCKSVRQLSMQSSAVQ